MHFYNWLKIVGVAELLDIFMEYFFTFINQLSRTTQTTN